MSEVWEKAEKEIKKYEEENPKPTKKKDYKLSLATAKELKMIEKGRVKALILELGKELWIEYILPIEADATNMSRIIDTLKEAGINKIEHKECPYCKLKDINNTPSSYLIRGNHGEELLYIKPQIDGIYITCYSKDAARLIDKVLNVFDLWSD
jgi:hypothetical protein